HPLTWSTGYLPLPAVLQLLSAIAEFIGAIALIFGLLTRLFAFLLLVDMIAAILLVKLPHGAVFVASAPRQASFERELLYCAVALVLLLVGPGRIALDALFAGRSIERGSFAG
ncbi:MAG: DoxX family protein, partial [Vulcanimicrobiaceae bacterium]